MPNLKELGQELVAKRTKLAEALAESKKDNGVNFTQEKYDAFQALHTEVNELGQKYTQIQKMDDVERENDAALKSMNAPSNLVIDSTGRLQHEQKSFGDIIAETPQFKSIIANRGKGSAIINIDGVDMKTLMTTLSGFPPPNNRTNTVIDAIQSQPVVADLISQTNTDLEVIKYMEESSYTNAVSPVVEGSALPESALSFVEKNFTVQKIGTFIPVTDEQLADEPMIRSIINERLLLFLRQKEEELLLNGTGAAPQIQGFLPFPGLGAYAQIAGETVSDAIYQAQLKVVTGAGAAMNAATVTGIVMNPVDWAKIRLEKDTQGRYIYGNPQDNVANTIWGIPIVQTVKIAAKTALLGDFRQYAQIARRTGITVEVGYINDQFLTGQQSIKITERVCQLIYRGNAFTKITLL